MHPTKLFALAAATALAGVAPASAQYRTLLTDPQIDPAATTLQGFTTSGTTVYAAFAGAGTGSTRPLGISRVDGVGTGAQTSTPLLTRTTFQSASGSATAVTGLTPGFGLSLSGTNLQFGDIGTRQVYRTNAVTGATSIYVNSASLPTGTSTTPQLNNTQSTAPDGQYVLYDGRGGTLQKSTGPNAVTPIVTSDQLTTATGTNSISSGLGFAPSGTFYFGANTGTAASGVVGGVYSVPAAGGTPTQVLSQADILTLSTDQTSVGFGDVEVGPDGRVYFFNFRGSDIFSFDPAAGASTLRYELTDAQLLAGPAASTGVSQLGFFGDQLAFIGGTAGPGSVNGIYVVPEPTTVAGAAALAGLTVLRRRRA